MIELDETHDPARQSWVASAQDPATDFPIQNLPLAVFRRRTQAGQVDADAWRVGVAIGSEVLDLAALKAAVGAGAGAAAAALQAGDADSLNGLMALGQGPRRALRRWLFGLLEVSAPAAVQKVVEACLMPQEEVEYRLPARVGDYTDFYIGIHHATAVGRLFRPDNPLLPNYKWVPIGYHGRASTVVVSGTDIQRPCGQIKGPQDEMPRLGPTQRLDFELELGLFIGPGNDMGRPIAIDQAEHHLFGVTLFNDWSARDIQAWEYQPLGPFLSKSFASSVSPWVVTMEALAPFRKPLQRSADDPPPLPYLDSTANRAQGLLDIRLAVQLHTEAMRRAGLGPQTISRSGLAEAAYWSPAQLVTHHTVNGCALAPGDLLGSGTLSGPEPEQAGSMLELTQGGRQPLALADGSTRSFLQDGDSVIFSGWCEAQGRRRIGFGRCEGRILPASA